MSPIMIAAIQELVTAEEIGLILVEIVGILQASKQLVFVGRIFVGCDRLMTRNESYRQLSGTGFTCHFSAPLGMTAANDKWPAPCGGLALSPCSAFCRDEAAGDDDEHPIPYG